MSLNKFCLWALVLLLGFDRAVAQETADRPNIVFILADDLGYMDLSSYAAHTLGIDRSATYYETPNLDRLVDEGLAFSQAYVTQLCSPTRASLLTGINSAVLGVTTAPPGKVKTYYNQAQRPPEGYHPQDVIYHGDDIDLPQSLVNATALTALPSGRPADGGRDVVTFAEAMPEYHSAFAGKWHLGGHGSEGYQPFDQGFRTLAYFDGGASPYYDWRSIWDREDLIFPAMPQKELEIGDDGEWNDAKYLTDALTQEAVHFIEERAQVTDEPFLLYLNHFAVHGPLQAPDEDVNRFEEKPLRGFLGRQHPTYAAMLERLDASVGAILETLEKTGLDENTLVVFLSDNGGLLKPLGKDAVPPTTNAPLKGGKATLFEGGIRVPLVFWWKGQISGGQWSDVPVHVTDLYPTLLEVGGYDAVSYEGEGQSLVALFSDPENTGGHYTRDTFYWHYPFNVIVSHPVDGLPLTPHSAIRRGDEKLIVDWHGRLWLYDIENDPWETNNLAEEQPERAKALFSQLVSWLDANVESRYLAKPNPDYDPDTDPRANSYRDLRQELLGRAESSGR